MKNLIFHRIKFITYRNVDGVRIFNSNIFCTSPLKSICVIKFNEMEWKEELQSIFLSMGKERTLCINYIANRESD